MKTGKRCISLLLALVMVFGMVPLTSLTAYAAETGSVIAEPVEYKVKQEDFDARNEAEALAATESTEPTDGTMPEVTRAQWLQALVKTFSMTVENEAYPDNYFVDLSSDSKYYYDMLLAVEFGVVDIPAGGSLRPDEPATREFAATTLNFCLGFQADPEVTLTFQESAQVANPYDIQTAIDRGWFALVDGAFRPEQPITQAEVNIMTADATAVLAAAIIDEDFESVYTYTADVIEVPDGTRVEAADNEVIIYNCPVDLTQGCVFAVYFEGIPCLYVAESVQGTIRRTVVKVSDVDDSLYYESVEAQGSVDAKFTDFVPEEGTEIIYIDEDTGEEYTDPVAAERAMAARAQDIRPQASGTVKLNRTIKVKQSLSKFGTSGYIEVEIKNPTIKYDISMSQKKVSIELNGDTDINYGIEADLMEALDLDEIKVGFIGVSGIGGITISVSLEAKAALYGSVSGKLTKGMSFSDGQFRLIKGFKKDSFSLVAEFSGKIGVVVKLGITDIPADVLEGYVYAEIGAEGKVTHKKYSDATCTHVAFYMYFEAGFKAAVKIGFYKKSWEYTADIWDDSNSPVRSVHHYDNGVLVPGCTLGNNGADTNNGYYTPTESPYWGSNWSGGDNSTGYNSAGQPVVTYGYSLDDDGNATITSYTGTATSLTIPKTIDGHPIVAIGSNVFKNKTGIHTVIMQDNIVTIGSSAFYGCKNLKNLTLSESLITIGSNAFQNCSSLTVLNLPKKVSTIGADAFNNCTALTSVYIPISVQEGSVTYKYNTVFDNAYGIFGGCTNLRNVTYEEGTTVIHGGLFAGSGLTEVIIPETVTTIGPYAFAFCKQLKSVTFPAALNAINQHAFWYCTSLEKLEFPNKLSNIGENAFANCTALTSVYIPVSVQEGAVTYSYNTTFDNASGIFGGCTNLRNVTYEEGTTRIHGGLFAGSGLTEVVIPETVTQIGPYAFAFCKNLKNITLPKNLTKISEHSFWYCESLSSIDFPDALTHIDGFSFSHCTGLKTIDMSKNLKEFGVKCFEYCTSLESIFIPKSMETIWYNTGDNYGPFSECSSLHTAVIEEGRTFLFGYLFSNCKGLKNITIPESITEIGEYCFNNCVALESISLPEKLTILGRNAFEKCSALKKIEMPDSITSLGNYCFANCSSLNSVRLPSAYTNITSNMFANCTSLERIELPATVETIRNDAFNGCTSLKEIVWSKTLTTIEANAFRNCDSLTSVTIPEGVMTLGNNVFYDCDSLETVDMANSVTSMGTYVFYHNNVLKNVKLSQSLTSIPNYTFSNCAQLEKIVVPYAVASIGSNAFTSSPKLTKVVTHANLTSINSTAFSYPDVTVFYGDVGSYTETWATENGYAFHENTVAATKVTLSDSSVSIAKGKTYTLRMAVEPIDFGGAIAFKSSNDSVATVDAAGKITAVAPGTATIKVTVGGVSASCKVTVTQAITRITLNKSSLSLNVPSTYQLTATINPADASNQVLKWTSSNTSAATVDSNGLVKAVGNGTAVITAATTDGTNLSASCTVTVVDLGNIPVSSISLNKTSLTLDAMDCYKLTATVSPTNAVNQNVVWSSSNDAVATVDTNGQVTAVAKGTATITASAADGFGAKATCQITVSNTAYIVTDVTKLESSHDYANSCSDFWVYTLPGAEKLAVTFDDRTMMEDGFDYLKIYDGSKNLIGIYTGTELAGQTISVPGNTVRIQLQSDNSGTEWGFKVTSVTAEGQIEINAPELKVSNVSSSGKVKLSWNAVEGAVQYAVWRAASKSGTYTQVSITENISVTDESTTVGKTYYYYVVAVAVDGTRSEPSAIKSRTCDLAQTSITVSNVASTGKVKISWTAVEGATKYEVYRATSKSGTYSRISTTANTSVTNTKAEAGKTYYYKVRAICDVDAAAGAYSSIKSRTCDLAQTTVTLSNVASTGKIKVSWTVVEGATKYEVYRATSKDGTYSRISTTSNTSVTNTKADAGKTYYYKVRAICDVDAAAAAYSSIKSRTCDLPRPDASIALSSSKPKVSWDKVTGAVEYKVYRATSKSGTYSLVKTTTASYYKDTKATAGKTYYYKVVAVCSNTAGNSAYSSIVSIKSK